MIDGRNVVIENAQIIFKHFSGDKFTNNLPTFGIKLDEDVASEFRDAGWPSPKIWVNKNAEQPDADPLQYYKLKVVFGTDREGNVTPQIVYKDLGTGKKTRVTEDNIHRLDNLRIKNATVEIFRGWSKQHECYYVGLNRLYLEIDLDDLSRKMALDDDNWDVDPV